jgi:hypothetical protein
VRCANFLQGGGACSPVFGQVRFKVKFKETTKAAKVFTRKETERQASSSSRLIKLLSVVKPSLDGGNFLSS